MSDIYVVCLKRNLVFVVNAACNINSPSQERKFKIKSYGRGRAFRDWILCVNILIGRPTIISEGVVVCGQHDSPRITLYLAWIGYGNVMRRGGGAAVDAGVHYGVHWRGRWSPRADYPADRRIADLVSPRK